MIDLEPCWSGLSSIFAKDVGAKPPREFESRRLRQLGKCKFAEVSSRRGTRRSHRI